MKVLLMCNAGMSISIMKMKLEQEAGKRGIELQITAIPMGELKEYINETDAILLGPQIRFALKDVTAEAGEKPVRVIAPKAPELSAWNSRFR